MTHGAPRPTLVGVRDPAYVTLTLWGVRAHHVPTAVVRMALDRRQLARASGLRFAKLLGTGDGRTFTLRDADPRHWGLLAVWDDESSARSFERGTTHRRWAGIAEERLQVAMAPLAGRGTWSGRAPFGRPEPRAVAGPVAAITRARVRLTRSRAFRSAVPAVAADLRQAGGLALALGIGEAPVGLQGTFSLWHSTACLEDFAYRRTPHARVVQETAAQGWFSEELFARLEVLGVAGTFDGHAPLLPTTGHEAG